MHRLIFFPYDDKQEVQKVQRCVFLLVTPKGIEEKKERKKMWKNILVPSSHHILSRSWCRQNTKRDEEVSRDDISSSLSRGQHGKSKTLPLNPFSGPISGGGDGGKCQSKERRWEKKERKEKVVVWVYEVKNWGREK